MTTQIKASILKIFIDKATVNGKVEDCKLQFLPEGLVMRHKDLPGILFVDAVLSKEAFDSYESNVSINVKNSLTLSKVLKTFGDNVIQITVENGQALFQSANGGYQLTLAEKVICHKENAPDLKYLTAEDTVIPASQLKLIVERNSIVNHNIVYTSIADKKLTMSVGKENDSADVILATDSVANVKTQFDSEYFEQVTKVFDDVVIASLDAEKPSKFVERTNTSVITVYLCKAVNEEGIL